MKDVMKFVDAIDKIARTISHIIKAWEDVEGKVRTLPSKNSHGKRR